MRKSVPARAIGGRRDRVAGCNAARVVRGGRRRALELAQPCLELGDAPSEVDVLALQLTLTEEADLLRGQGSPLRRVRSIDEASPDDRG